MSYLFNENAQFDVFYQYSIKDNTEGDLEALAQNNYGVSFTYNNAQKIALTGEFNFFKNDSFSRTQNNRNFSSSDINTNKIFSFQNDLSSSFNFL